MKIVRFLNKSNTKSNNYPKEAFKILYEIEDKHFWFAGRKKLIKEVIEKFIKNKNKLSFLEIGCGNGILLSMFEKLGFSVTGLDINREGLKFARKRTNATLICASLSKFHPKGKYGAIGLFDVLEHIEDDKSFLEKCKSLLRAKGTIFITVPANMILWSKMDEVSGHKRRYTKKDLNILLQRTGYRVEFINYFNYILFIPLILFRKFHDIKLKIRKSSGQSLLVDELRVPPLIINAILKWICFLEAQLVMIATIPFGASLVAVAKKE